MPLMRVNLLANFRCLEVRPGSMGKPTPGFDVCMVDDDGNVLGPRQEGHVAVRVKPIGRWACSGSTAGT